jgi:RsiW-degrading membrane proteinase PrsW (M82 family)
MFAVGTWFFYRAGRKHGGNLGKIARLLMWGGVAGCIAAGFRYLGDFFTQYKWLESTGGLIFAVISVIVAYLVSEKFSEIARVFGLMEEE